LPLPCTVGGLEWPLTVQRDGQVPAGNHGSARHALRPEHPQDVQRGRTVDEHAAFVRGGRSEQTKFLLEIYNYVAIRRRAYDAALASGKPGVRHDRGDLVEELLVGFHFTKPNPLDNS
jgi:hypothetical protein